MTEQATATKRRLLIADDHGLMREVMACFLEGAPEFEVVAEAEDGREAVDLAGQLAPDMVLMDISMPRMSGYDAARAIRGAPWGRGMVLIALTGWGRSTDLEQARAAGFDGHLLKPVEPDALIRLISDLRARRISP
ncbi:MAG: response regulator [Chloroflexota bacterium]